MPLMHRIVQPGRLPGTLLLESGEELTPAADWAFLSAGDAAITRSVKTQTDTWVVQIRRGKRLISKGIWAKEAIILAAQQEVEAKRSTPEYEKRRQKDLARRQASHNAYVGEFCAEVFHFLDFHPRYGKVASLLAGKITAHATPVGSGTVARTERIPMAGRAEAAVIAWMRHQTTAYDSMRIARIKGKRKEVRRELAAQSVAVLQPYRQGLDIAAHCPLQKTLV